MPIGNCEFCGQEISIPQHVLAWVDNHRYHEECYQLLLTRGANKKGTIGKISV